MSTNFDKEELVVAFERIQYKSEHMVSMTEVTLCNIQTCLIIPLPPNETMPNNREDNLEAMVISIQPDVFHFISDPLCFGINKAQPPEWCKHVVELLKERTLYKEWMHT